MRRPVKIHRLLKILDLIGFEDLRKPTVKSGLIRHRIVRSINFTPVTKTRYLSDTQMHIGKSLIKCLTHNPL